MCEQTESTDGHEEQQRTRQRGRPDSDGIDHWRGRRVAESPEERETLGVPMGIKEEE